MTLPPELWSCWHFSFRSFPCDSNFHRQNLKTLSLCSWELRRRLGVTVNSEWRHKIVNQTCLIPCFDACGWVYAVQNYLRIHVHLFVSVYVVLHVDYTQPSPRLFFFHAHLRIHMCVIFICTHSESLSLYICILIYKLYICIYIYKLYIYTYLHIHMNVVLRNRIYKRSGIQHHINSPTSSPRGRLRPPKYDIYISI